MITDLIIYIAVIFVSILSSVFPNTQLIPAIAFEAIDTVSSWIVGLDNFFPGVIAFILEKLYIIIAFELTILAFILGKRVINWIRGVGKL